MIGKWVSSIFRHTIAKQPDTKFAAPAEELRQARGALAQTTVKFERALHDFDVLHKNALRILDEGEHR